MQYFGQHVEGTYIHFKIPFSIYTLSRAKLNLRKTGPHQFTPTSSQQVTRRYLKRSRQFYRRKYAHVSGYNIWTDHIISQ